MKALAPSIGTDHDAKSLLRHTEEERGRAEKCAAVQVLSAGADGLVKLWGVRTSECLATFDEHEAKVWAMHVAGRDDSTLVTGGADARVNVWRDCTAQDEATAAAGRAEAAVKGQALSNALQVRLPPLDCTCGGQCSIPPAVVCTGSKSLINMLPPSVLGSADMCRAPAFRHACQPAKCRLHGFTQSQAELAWDCPAGQGLPGGCRAGV